MSELLNAVTTTETYTTYDRSFAGQYQNPYGGVPSLTFHMHRCMVRDSDDKLITEERLADTTEPFAPGKVYDLFNPATGEKIPGATFTTEQVYAMLYSVMRQRLG